MINTSKKDNLTSANLLLKSGTASSQSPSFQLPYSENEQENDITFVTGFVAIENFHKKWRGIPQNKSTYLEWMRSFGKLRNRVMVYLEDPDIVDVFRSIRSQLPWNLTQVVQIRKRDLWSYTLLPQITKVYVNKSYPKTYPNTVLPEYPCLMHTKYEFLLYSILTNPFKTKYFAWIDIGIFRKEMDGEPFVLRLPNEFDENKVAFTQVDQFKNITAEQIFMDNVVWVGGGVFVAKASVMLTLVEDYLLAVQHFLSRGLMNSDQQVIYAMMTDPGFKARVKIQVYKGYYAALAYQMKHNIKS